MPYGRIGPQMEPYGPIWARTEPILWPHMGRICHMGPYWPTWAPWVISGHVGTYGAHMGVSGKVYLENASKEVGLWRQQKVGRPWLALSLQTFYNVLTNPYIFRHPHVKEPQKLSSSCRKKTRNTRTLIFIPRVGVNDVFQQQMCVCFY